MALSSPIVSVKRYNSPCGTLIVGSCNGRLCLCDWESGRHSQTVDRRMERLLGAKYREEESEVTAEACRQLDDYFARRRKRLDVPLLLVGTDFQRQVWNALLQIPYGTTVSYGALSQRLGSATAVRAVANAVGANAISIFVPCHRVVGSDGMLTGYAGGLEAKRSLLDLEQASLLRTGNSGVVYL
ncbi:MAG: methylated-DNA--[protein]-cysteine S-methyltransferase [Bacteroidales bacterium]|nr:methylated-DNA--[protein]-cysteine S-methyltransferase [Bacteroidales bacterium]